MEDNEPSQPSILPDTILGRLALGAWCAAMVVRQAMSFGNEVHWVSNVILVGLFASAALALWGIVVRHDRGVMLWLPIIYGVFFALFLLGSLFFG